MKYRMMRSSAPIVGNLFLFFSTIITVLVNQPIMTGIGIFMILFTNYIWLCRRIIIYSAGVAYNSWFRKYELNWQDIKTIGVRYYGTVPWIYFTNRNELDCGHAPMSEMTRSDDYILMNYRREAIEDIKKFWAGHITGPII